MKSSVIFDWFQNTSRQQRKEMAVAGLISTGCIAFFLLVATVIRSGHMSLAQPQVSQYLEIAEAFDVVAAEIDLGTTAVELSADHRFIGDKLWENASPNLDLDKLLLAIHNPPRDKQEQADRIVASGQVAISVAIVCLQRGNLPNPRKTASDLREVAQRLRSSVQ